MSTPSTFQQELTTADDFLVMPDSRMYELVRGVIVPRPLSSFESSTVAVNSMVAVREVVEPRRLGSMTGADGGYILARDPDTVRVMDFASVRADRMPPREKWDHFLELAPDLAVEVVSPSDTVDGVQQKIIEYLDAGVRLIWIVYPIPRTVAVYYPDRTISLLRDDDVLDGGDVLPGFAISVADILD